MPSLLAHALLIIGIALIGTGLGLSFRDSKTLPVTLMLSLGVLCCLVDNPAIQNIVITSSNLNVTVTKKELDQKVAQNEVDRQADVIGPINLKLQDIAKSLSAQETVNRSIVDRLSRLEATSNVPATATSSATIQPNILTRNPAFIANNVYSIIVFFKDSRKDDATKIVPALTAAGFQASSINTTLNETQVGFQPDASTYIVSTDKGRPIEGMVAQVVRQTLPAPRNGAVTADDKPYDLRRGDLQIYLY